MADSRTTPADRQRRVLLVGLDAADHTILLDGMNDGSLPHLARLRAAGAWGVVSSPSGFGSGAVWPSVATAVSPAKHSRYYYQQVPPRSYEAVRFEPEDFRAEPVWKHLSDQGCRIAIYDVPKVGVSPGVNGRIAVDWLSHGGVGQHGLVTWPESYAEELVARYGSNPLPRCDMPGGRNPEQMREFMSIMEARVRQRERCTIDAWADPELDLLVTVFAEPHCVGHQAWHVRDADHPQHDAAANAELGDPIAGIYQMIDASIGRIVDAVHDDTVVIVFSGTGMGPNYTGNHVLDEVLRRLEGAQVTTRRSLTTRAKRLAKRMLPIALRRRARPLKRRVEERAAVGDRARRRAFAVPHNDIAGAVRLNIVGRERNGVLQPEDVPAYIERLRTSLVALRNADTGAPVVERVVETRSENVGDYLDHLPDVFVIWHRDQPIDRVTSPEVGLVQYVHRGNRTGDHNPESLIVAAGPGVVAGELIGTSIYDVMPTVAAILGVELPETDGTVIGGLVPVAPARA